MKAVFLDRDGTINVGTPVYARIDSTDKLRLLPTVMEALSKLAHTGYGVFLITNQAGIAEGLISEAEFECINTALLAMIAPSGLQIIKTYHCPHGESSDCPCRKPKPKMILDAAQEYSIDLKNSWMIGDRITDVQTAYNAGVSLILVQSGAKQSSKDATYTAPTLLAAVEYVIAHTTNREQ